MTQGSSINKNEVIELAITKNNRQRLVVGLAWNARTATKGEMGKATAISVTTRRVGYVFWPIAKILNLFGVKTGEASVLSPDYIHNILRKDKTDDVGDKREESYKEFDLDLSCFIYDDVGSFVTAIGPDFDQYCDPSSKVYHSGEEQIGSGGPDDEQIHIETKDIPENYAHIFIVITSDCHFKLGDTAGPVVRLADSATESNFISATIAPPANEDAYGYVFTHMYKQNQKWYARYMHEFTDPSDKWEVYLKRYLARNGE